MGQAINSGLTQADVSGSISRVLETRPTGRIMWDTNGTITGGTPAEGKTWFIRGTLGNISAAGGLSAAILGTGTRYIARAPAGGGQANFETWIVSTDVMTSSASTNTVWYDYWEFNE